MKEVIGILFIFLSLAAFTYSRVESDAEVLARYRRPSTTVLLPIGRVQPKQKSIEDHVNEAADTIGLRRALLRGMIKVESDWNPRARREEKKLKTRSRGLTQVLETTAAIYGVKGHELEDPEISIWTGGLYLRDMIAFEKGSEFWGVVAYNAGPRKNRMLYPRSAIVHANKVIEAAKKYVG